MLFSYFVHIVVISQNCEQTAHQKILCENVQRPWTKNYVRRDDTASHRQFRILQDTLCSMLSAEYSWTNNNINVCSRVHKKKKTKNERSEKRISFNSSVYIRLFIYSSMIFFSLHLLNANGHVDRQATFYHSVALHPSLLLHFILLGDTRRQRKFIKKKKKKRRKEVNTLNFAIIE